MVEGLEAAIEELLALDPASLDDAALHRTVIDLQRLTSRFSAARAALVSAWDARCTWATDFSKSPAARLARDVGCSPTTARAEVRRARKLRTMAVTAEAYANGDLSTDHVDLLCGVNHAPLLAAFAEAEQRLVSDAKRLDYDDFAQILQYWRNAADDDATEDRATKARQGRSVTYATLLDGEIDLRARLDAIDGAIVTGELDRLERRLFEADWAEARATHGDDVRLDHLARTTTQRRADALVEMATRSTAATDDATVARPLVSVLCDYETFAGQVCELANGTVITPGQIAGLLTDADIERIVFDTPSRVIDVGRRTRVFTGALRRAIEIRDRHCTHPGCRVPAEHCHVDHIIEYCDGGETTQDNGRLLCATHNRQRPGRTTPPPAGP